MAKKSEDPQVLYIAGAFSGVAEAIAVQPFDMVKTRHQLNTGQNLSVTGTLRAIYSEGGIRRFYRGMTPELIGMVPKSSGMYGTYELVRLHLAKDYGDVSWVAAAGGLASGVPESLIVTPTQVVKVRMQAREHLGRYTSPLDCLQKTLKFEGLRSMYIGLGPTLWRNCVWNTVYFGTMHKLKSLTPQTSSPVAEMGLTLITGFFGAVFATCFNSPFDVAKSRFQSQIYVEGEIPKYRFTWQTLYLVYKEEGIGAVYKGFKPKAIRMGLGGAVAMFAFELVTTNLRL
jgi:solute carrier family 25 2-oxodicarboxylate transporter 21